MPSFLLRFESRAEASAELAFHGADLPGENPVSAMLEGRPATIMLAFGDGIARHLTGETADFEGETLLLSRMQAGFHLLLHSSTDLPLSLLRYVVQGEPE
jgi:hypothetical protein